MMRANEYGINMAALLAAGVFGAPSDLLNDLEGLDLDSIQFVVDNVNPFEELPAGLLGAALFPAEQVDDLNFIYLKGAGNGAVMMAGVNHHMGEAPLAPRRGADQVAGQIPAIKLKRMKDALELIKLQNARGEVRNALIQKIYDDITANRKGVIARKEWLRMQALATGVASITGEGNVIATVDYQVPAGHKATLAGTDLWSDTVNSDPLADLEAWQNIMVADQGVRMTRIVSGSGPRNAFRAHPKVREAVFGVNKERRLTLAEVNAFLAEQDLPVFLDPYDLLVHQLQADGTMGAALRLFPNDRITLIPGPEFGQLGRTLEAPTATESLRGVAEGRVAVDGERIATHVYVATQDPKNLVSLAEASAFPSFENADYVFQAKVL